MKTELNIRKDNFVDKDGKNVEYFVFEVVVGGVSFRLKPDMNDKKLLNYLLRAEFDK